MEQAQLRLDKWLWHARVVKTRTLAARLVTSGKVRVNKERIVRPARTVRPGDILTIAVHRRIKVLKIVALGSRRGPASEAQALFEDLSPPAARSKAHGDLTPTHAARQPGSGRPTKRERRQTDSLRTDTPLAD